MVNLFAVAFLDPTFARGLSSGLVPCSAPLLLRLLLVVLVVLTPVVSLARLLSHLTLAPEVFGGALGLEHLFVHIGRADMKSSKDAPVLA